MSLVDNGPLRWDQVARSVAGPGGQRSLLASQWAYMYESAVTKKKQMIKKESQDVKYSHGSCYCFCLHTVEKEKKIWNR